MTEKRSSILEAADFLRSKGFGDVRLGIVLGTGLGNLVERMKIIHQIEYKDIPHFPLSTVEFHSGKLLLAEIMGNRVVAMQGRFHHYEGYDFQQITFPIRVMKLLGIELLILSNAAGSLNPDFLKGELMLIDDHINLQPGNPLIGPNLDDLGPRFPDMSEPYDAKLNQDLHRIAKENNINLNEGIYVSVAGPMLETRAEYRFLRRIGADAVGMSTVPEVITARHMGMKCVAISVLTDECDPDNLKPVDISEIIAIAGKAEKKLSILLEKFIENLK